MSYDTADMKNLPFQTTHSGNQNGDNDDQKCYDDHTCEKSGSKTFDVSVPVSIKPTAIPQKPEVNCLGEAKIYPGRKRCNNNHDSFEFTIAQKMRVKTPVDFGVETCFDKTCVEEIGAGNDQGEDDDDPGNQNEQ